MVADVLFIYTTKQMFEVKAIHCGVQYSSCKAIYMYTQFI